MEVIFDHKKKILSAIGIGLIIYLTKKGKESKVNKSDQPLEENSEAKANKKVSNDNYLRKLLW